MNQDQVCGAATVTGATCKHKPGFGHTKCWLHRGPQCSVCLGTIVPTSGTRKLPCGHEFHSKCIERWKRTCHGDPTCPMCREPFDLPTYRCRLIIEKVDDGTSNVSQFETSNISPILQGFGLNIRDLMPDNSVGRFITDIHFDIDEDEDLDEVLRELGIPT